MKKYTSVLKITALVLMVIIACSGCGLLNLAGTLNNGAVAPTNPPPAHDVIYNDPYYSEDITYSAVISNPDNTTTTVAGTNASQNTTAQSTNSAPATSDNKTEKHTSAPATEATTVNTFEDGDYLANVQDVLFNSQDENAARKVLVAAGFEYDPIQDVYYTQLDSWQRNFGFNSIYDSVAPMVGMLYSTSRIRFTYDDKDWMLEIWKGQYGITAGGEMGFYNKPTDRVMKHYDCVTDEEMITMSFDFYNMDEYVFTRGPEKHWWLTGFKFLHVGIPQYIELDMTLEFPNRKMANAFEAGLKKEVKNQLTDPMKYTRTGDTFNIVW